MTKGWSMMEYRQLGRSGLRESTLTLGTMTFGGRGGFRAVGATDVVAVRRHVDMCLDAGVNLIDTADVYSGGLAEEITGEVVLGRRDALLLSTKVRMSMGDGPNDVGLTASTSSPAARPACAGSGPTTSTFTTCTSGTGRPGSRRLCPRSTRSSRRGRCATWRRRTTPVVADQGARAGRQPRLRAVLGPAGLRPRSRPATPSTSSLPLSVDQGLGILVWSPLAGGPLASAIYRLENYPCEQTRQLSGEWHEPPVRDREKLYDTIEVLVGVAAAHGATPAQVALAWLLGLACCDLAHHRGADRRAAARQPRRGLARAGRGTSARRWTRSASPT